LEKTLSSKLLYEGRNFSFKTDVVELPHGQKTKRDVVEHPGAAAIIPILPNGDLILVRQYRYAVEKELLEIPAGTLKKDENPLKCAIRELKEETGYQARKMKKIMKCYMAPGYSSELIHFYVATELKKSEAEADFDESIKVENMKLEEALDKIKENTIEDAKTIAGILAYFCFARAME